MLRIQDAILYGSKGGSSPSGSIEITENGTYDVTEKASAVVDVEPDLTTKQITQNGTYSASSDNVDGYSAVTVAVPQPSGKITISQNGTDIDVSGYALADVNVSGGVNNEDGIIERSISGNYVNNRITKVENYAFRGCSFLTGINFPLVTRVGKFAFRDCSRLTEVNLPLVTILDDDAFDTCPSLTEVNFPLVSSICTYVFDGCSNLSEINFPSATSIGSSAFNRCMKLTEVSLPSATSLLASAFRTCTNLTKVDLPSATSIGTYVFDGCSKLTSLILRNTTQVATLDGTSAFNSTPIKSGTGYIYVPAALIDSYKAATNWSSYAAQFRALEDYTVDGTTTGDLDPTKI